MLPLLPKDKRRSFEDICTKTPDLRLDMAEEGHINFKNGTREVWLLNPETRRVFIYLPDAEEIYENPDRIESRILKGFTLILCEVWKGLSSHGDKFTS